MEIENDIHPINLKTGQWQWCSADPCEAKDPMEWIWDDDPFETNFLLEEHFARESMRRKEERRFTMEMMPGAHHHFFDYIMKRAPEAYEFYQGLREIPLDCPLHEFAGIVTDVILCVEDAAGAREKMFEERLGCKKQNFRSESEEIREYIYENSESFGDFMRAILKVFTMEKFLYSYLNELLRNEVWEEINILTPFLGCLLYGLQFSKSLMQRQKSQDFEMDLLDNFQEEMLHLHRGMALTEELLEMYKSQLTYFTWKNLSSTSRSPDVGKKFTELSLEGNKIGVLFIIEVDFASLRDWEGFIDLSPISKYPKEQEILLAPGIVFEVQKVCPMGNGYNRCEIGHEIGHENGYEDGYEDGYEIHVKVKRVFDRAVQVDAVHRKRRNELTSEEKAKINRFLLQLRLRLLKLLRDSTLTQEPEIQRLMIEQHIMEEIAKMGVTLEVKKDNKRLDKQFKLSCLGTVFRQLL